MTHVLLVKGRSVRLVLDTGKSMRASGAMMHDPRGTHWPRCSFLIGPYRRGGETYSDSESRSYFGRGYVAHKGSADVPNDRSLSSWTHVGNAVQIFYVRTGAIYGGQLFRHKFSRPVKVYRKGRWTRLELGSFCVANWRGIVAP